jgi:predicted lysophospholipase L1 biosynthesis ABC-type transport system permease subunit
MPIPLNSKLRIPTLAIFFLIIFIGVSLIFGKILAFNQFVIVFFGDMGAYFVINVITKVTADSILKRHEIFFIVTLVPSIALLTILLLISPINTNLSVITIAMVIFSIGLFMDIVDWHAKRKQNRTNETPKN